MRTSADFPASPAATKMQPQLIKIGKNKKSLMNSTTFEKNSLASKERLSEAEKGAQVFFRFDQYHTAKNYIPLSKNSQTLNLGRIQNKKNHIQNAIRQNVALYQSQINAAPIKAQDLQKTVVTEIEYDKRNIDNYNTYTSKYSRR